jgi:hypothetical protein
MTGSIGDPAIDQELVHPGEEAPHICFFLGIRASKQLGAGDDWVRQSTGSARKPFDPYQMVDADIRVHE